MSLPKICRNHSSKDGCDDINGCTRLHICYFFVTSTCSYGAKCNHGHDLTAAQPARVLAQHDINVFDDGTDDVLEKLRSSLVDGRTSSTRAYPSVSSPSLTHGVSGRRAVVKVCSNYNHKDGCTVDNCQQLHLCRHFVEGTCKFNPCIRSHLLLSGQPRKVLVDCEFDIQTKEKDILGQLRELLTRDKDQKQSIKTRSKNDSIGKGRCEASDSDADPKVCIYHLFDRCIFKKNDCFNYHSQSGLPYQWQWKSSLDSCGDLEAIRNWSDFCQIANVEIESKFCQVTEEHVRVQEDALGGLIVVNFESMTFGGQMTPSGVVRRLGTDPVATSAKRNRYTSVWTWYCQSDDVQGQWQAYPHATPTSQDDDMATGGVISSFDIELKYLANPLARLQYQTTTGKGQVRRLLIDLKQMTLTDLSRPTQEILKVRRRPELFRAIEKQIMDESLVVDQSSAKSIRYPECWTLDKMKDLPDVDYELVLVSSSGPTADEYSRVISLFAKTMPDTCKSLWRIQNQDLWESFDAFRTRMNRNRATPVIPMSLFHGTKSNYLDPICRQGFDWRMCGSSVGTLWGKGVYFARDAEYSKSYTDCKKMLIVQVLVGDYALGNSSYSRPPPKDPKKPYHDLFDSVVNDVNCPSIFVIFERNQAYPAYQIEF